MNSDNPVSEDLRNLRLVEGIVSCTAIFRAATPRQQAEIAAQSRMRSVPRGAYICRLGEPTPGLLVVGYGMLKIALRRQEGDERVVRFVGANETFGEAPALLGRTAPFDAAALTDSMLVVVPCRPVLKLLAQHPGFAEHLVASLSESYLSLLSELRASVHSNGTQRLASFLHSLAHPAEPAASCTVRLPASKSQIAARLGITKETMSRLLRALASQGLISVSGREIELLDRPRLAELAT